MIDLSVTVPPGQKRTLWLDLRDRILPNDSLYLSIAASDPAFSAKSLDGARIRLVFKPRAQALTDEPRHSPRHVAHLRSFGVDAVGEGADFVALERVLFLAELGRKQRGWAVTERDVWRTMQETEKENKR